MRSGCRGSLDTRFFPHIDDMGLYLKIETILDRKFVTSMPPFFFGAY